MSCMTSTSNFLYYNCGSSNFLKLLFLLSLCTYRSNEHFHVKTNMVHTLYRVKSVGCIPLVSLKIWLTEEEYRRCLNSPHINKTWYPLTTDVFVALLFRVIFLLTHDIGFFFLIICIITFGFLIMQINVSHSMPIPARD